MQQFHSLHSEVSDCNTRPQSLPEPRQSSRTEIKEKHCRRSVFHVVILAVIRLFLPLQASVCASTVCFPLDVRQLVAASAAHKLTSL